MKRAYLVRVEEFVFIADVDSSDFFQRAVRDEAEAIAAERVHIVSLTREELYRRDNEVPIGCWDPERPDMTCFEIAADIPRVALLDMAERLGRYAGHLLELVA